MRRIVIAALSIIAAAAIAAIFISTTNNKSSHDEAEVHSTTSLNLPRIAWEGGPAYWNQFPVAKAAGWTNPNFFPIGIWFDSVSSSAEVQADKSYGINLYIGESPATNYNLFADNHVYVLNTLSNTPAHGTAQPGLFLADEPDGLSASSATALTKIKNIVAASPNDGRFKVINFSMTVINGSDPRTNEANFEGMVGSYAGPVSVDKYYYTQPSCFDVHEIIEPIVQSNCRTSSSYGATVRALRTRLAATGHPKPVWNFIEDLSGAPDPDHYYAYIQPGQLEGAVMNSIINEARGVLYFNQSFAGTCTGGNIIRQVQTGSLPCAQPQVNAMKQVDLRTEALAPVLNTQSYQYSFGPNLNTMLKTYQRSAYIFAMISGSASSRPGNRTFKLPADLAGAKSVQVLNENREVPVVNGQFTDNFAHEYTYHIYKVTM